MRYGKMMVSAIMLSLLVLSALLGSAEPIFKATFNENPFTTGWVAKTSAFTNERQNGPFNVGIETKPGAGKDYYLLLNKGCMQTPSFPVTPLNYYKLSFSSKAAGKGYWGGIFFDDKGQEVAADIYDTVFPTDDWQQIVICVRARINAKTMCIRFQTIDAALALDDITIDPIDNAGVVQWMQDYAAQLPPVTFTPEANRWQYLPRTMKTLQNGGKLRIVMLGDSIINDTSNSLYEAKLRQMYPKAQIEIINSIRGGTGCDYYKDNDQVTPYVLDYKPDLLIIGGISNASVEGIRSVIKQVRAKSNPEILVLTQSLCPSDPAHLADNKAHPRLPGTEKYAAELMKMASEEKVEYFDIHQAWDAYIAASPQPEDWFKRDTIHANSHAKQVVGQFLDRYFSPKGN